MHAVPASRALVPYANRSTADLATRVAVSLSLLSWLGVVVAMFWH